MIDTHGAVYVEEQSLSPRLLAFIVFAAGIAGLGVYAAAGDGPAASAGPLAVLAAMIAVVIVFSTFNLTTTVENDGVRVKGMWVVNRLIRFDEISSAEKREYRPIAEYGGWGYRIGPSGKAYNAQGNEGVQLVLKNGGRVLIGSQRADELAGLIASRLRG